MSSRSSGPVASILDVIGDTPLLRIDGIWAKLEFLNPSGSIKARIAKFMIERAEQEGVLRPGDTIVEASSGNTGNALSMVAAAKGYPMLVVMPRGLSTERVRISRAFGARVELVGDFHLNEALRRADALGRRPGYFCPRQFESEWNIEENTTWLGPEVLDQMPDGAVPDALVMGVGTGGTLIGVGRAFRAVNPRAKVIGVEPDESCTILCGETGRHVIEGIADGFVPGIVARNLAIIDDVVAVSGEESIAEMRRLAHEHGLFVGPSSGAHLVAARRLRDQHPDLEHIVTILCDEGEKYLSEHFGTGDSEDPPPAPTVPATLPWSTTHPRSSPGSPDPSVKGSGTRITSRLGSGQTETDLARSPTASTAHITTRAVGSPGTGHLAAPVN